MTHTTEHTDLLPAMIGKPVKIKIFEGGDLLSESGGTLKNWVQSRQWSSSDGNWEHTLEIFFVDPDNGASLTITFLEGNRPDIYIWCDH